MLARAWAGQPNDARVFALENGEKLPWGIAMVRSGSLFLVFLFLAALLGYEWNGGLAAPAFVGFDEQSKGFTPADLPADEKELADLDRQIDTKEKQLAELRMKASALRATVGLGQTWVEIGGNTYGAKPDERGPIGGGPGYNGVVTKGSYRVATLDDLLRALQKAKKGEVVFVDGGAEIDCTERVHIEKLVLEIPAGVTLASNRGQSASLGALIRSDTFSTWPLIRTLGPGVRVTGLRLQGPDPKRRMEHHRLSFDEGRGHEYYSKFPISDGIVTNSQSLEVDNCELSAWSHAAIFLMAGDGHRIHHNFIHHCQYNGLGYGICHDRAFSLVECNVFNWNRCSIAGTGVPESGYEARNNVQLETGLIFHFEMHGGEARGDGTDIAAKWIRIHHNTFRGPIQAISIRGVPKEGAEVHSNWFNQQTRDAVSARDKTRVFNNAYGPTKPKLLDPAL
jgi:hypothetical protein